MWPFIHRFSQYAMEYNQNVIENCNSKIYPRIGFLCYHFIKFYETNSINCAQNCTSPSRIQFSDEIIFGVVKTKTNGTKMQLSIVVRDMSTHTDSYFNEDIYHEFNSIIMKLTILISWTVLFLDCRIFFFIFVEFRSVFFANWKKTYTLFVRFGLQKWKINISIVMLNAIKNGIRIVLSNTESVKI